jgi:hypothetical protein
MFAKWERWPDLPIEYQAQFDLVLTKTEQKMLRLRQCAEEASAQAHGRLLPMAAAAAAPGILGMIAETQNLFFQYCENARAACQSGTWTSKEALRAVKAALSDFDAPNRALITGDDRYQVHLREFEAIISARTQPQSAGSTKKRSGVSARSRDEVLEALRKTVRKLKADGLPQLEMCRWLDANEHPRPEGARWSALTWTKAFRAHGGSVKKWLSKAGRQVTKRRRVTP